MTIRGGKVSPRTLRVLATLCAATWIGAFVATHLPPGGVPSMGPSDKVLHLIGYAVLASPLILLLNARGSKRPARIVRVLALLLVYAAFDEITQPIVGRSADVLDWLCDAAGAALALTFWEIVFAAWPRRAKAQGQAPQDARNAGPTK